MKPNNNRLMFRACCVKDNICATSAGHMFKKGMYDIIIDVAAKLSMISIRRHRTRGWYTAYMDEEREVKMFNNCFKIVGPIKPSKSLTKYFV